MDMTITRWGCKPGEVAILESTKVDIPILRPLPGRSRAWRWRNRRRAFDLEPARVCFDG